MHRFGGFNAPPPPSTLGSDDESDIVGDTRSGQLEPRDIEIGLVPPSVLGVNLGNSSEEQRQPPPAEEISGKKPRGVSFGKIPVIPLPTLRERKPANLNGMPVGINIPPGNPSSIFNPSPRPTFTKQQSITRSLAMCLDPTCTSCPPEYHALRKQLKINAQNQQASRNLRDELAGLSDSDNDDDKSTYTIIRQRVQNIFNLKRLSEHAREFWNTIRDLMKFEKGIHPNSSFVKNWNQFFVWAMIIAFAVDPLFFFVTAVDPDAYCIYTQWSYVRWLSVLRTIADFVYFLHMLLQFRLAYREPAAPQRRMYWWGSVIAPKNPGEFTFNSKQIAMNYLKGWFVFDFLGVLPLPQVFALAVIPQISAGTASFSANLLRAVILFQYFPRVRRCYSLISGTQNTGFLFESAWASFTLNLIMYIMSSHVVGALWYMASTERYNTCAQRSCQNRTCNLSFLNCPNGVGTISSLQAEWVKNGTIQTDCGPKPGDNFNYGIFEYALPLILDRGFFTKYIYALQWGFQQISTLGGNQVPSTFVPEILFLFFITAGGLLLFAVLIGNIQTFLQSLTRRTFEYQLHRRDVEQWMQRRNLPRVVARKVRELERLQWRQNQGVNESEVLGSLSEDLQRDIRRHLCLELVKKSKLFSVMDDAVLDFICERLVQRIYIPGTVVVREGFPVSRMFFVLKGELESVTTAGGRTGFFNKDELTNGDFVGEELLIAYLEQSDEFLSTKSKKSGRRASRRFSRGESSIHLGSSGGPKLVDVLPPSERTITCTGPVEGFTLEAEDLEFMCRQFKETLHSDRVQKALNQCSRSRQTHAAVTIQLRYRSHLRKRLNITLAHFQLAQKERRIEGVVRTALEKPHTRRVEVLLNPVFPSRGPPPRIREEH